MIACILALIFLIVQCRRRPAAAIAFAFVLFTFVARLIAAAYVGAVGESEAEEMSGPISSPTAATAFAAAITMSTWFMFRAFRPEKMRVVRVVPYTQGWRVFSNAFALIMGLFVLVLYVDMFQRGVIPLFAGIERGDYSANYAGPFHGVLMDHGIFLSFWLGALLLLPVLSGHPADMRCAGLFLAILFYLFLAGHRFSAFFSFSSFFLMPFAALFVRGPRPVAGRARALLSLRRLWIGLAIVVSALVLYALFNSFFNVRAYDQADDKLVQRVFVQPVQLWWATWTRVSDGDWNPVVALGFQFVAPLDPSRNTGMQYLMVLELGVQRVADLLDVGQQYTGGYPEILFETFGPWFGWLATGLSAMVTAWVTRVALIAYVEGRFITVFAALYVFFGLSLLILGGMLNFFGTWTYWAKLAVLITANIVESRMIRRSVARRGSAPSRLRPALA